MHMEYCSTRSASLYSNRIIRCTTGACVATSPMGNRYHASLSFGLVALLVSAFAFPLFTHAASLHESLRASITERMIARLCERQAALSARLPRPLINPALCAPSTEPTLTLTATPASIEEGDDAVLAWSSTNATSCTASGGWSGSKSISGEEEVSPEETSTYTLACTGAGGTVTKSVTVTVMSSTPEPSLSFMANPTSVVVNGTSTLIWDSTNATSCLASDGWSGAKDLDGVQMVTVSATTTYTLACGNGVSTSTRSVTVNVTPTPTLEPTVDISANPITINEGASAQLTWNSENATSCVASNGWSGAKSLDGTESVSPTATTTYAIECTGAGGVAQDSVTVNVVLTQQDVPAVDLSANPTSVTPGAGSATSTLSWTTTGADFCSAGDGWSGTKGSGGSEIVEPSATTTYSLSCGNEAGTSTDSVTITFVPESTPSVDNLLISEVHYDVASSTVAGNDALYEWIEIYNPTNDAVNLQGWFVGDASSTDMIDENSSIAAGGYVVVAASSTPAGIPSGVPVIVLFSSIGSNGFANGGDGARLLDASEVLVDSVGYGTNVTVSPNVAIPTVTDGHSLRRVQLTNDTDTAADWDDSATTTPGA